MATKKLIEVALPLDKINDGCVQEKNPFLKKHPRSMHLWWARRPLAAARAILFAQLVDDPSSHPDLFPTEEDQERERNRLFSIIEKISSWKNINNERIIEEARTEVKKNWVRACNESENKGHYEPDEPPWVHDPFAGGGSIPLEAQRLGLNAVASDLNPVAVLINKALIEYPHMFSGMKPVNPESEMVIEGAWNGAEGLAADVRYYGNWMRKEAKQRIGKLYPKVVDENGQQHETIAWIWFRTVKCPNPLCGCNMPLASTFDLSTKKGNEAWVSPILDYKNKKITYRVKHGKNTEHISAKLGRGAKFRCIMCGEMATDEYIKQEAAAGRMDEDLACVVGNSKNGRVYISPDDYQEKIAHVEKPKNCPNEQLPYDPRNIWCVNYGVDTYDKLFSNRQLTAMTTYCDLVAEARSQAIKDGASDEYANAIAVYLACGVSQLSRYSCKACGWNKTNENVAQAFGRQAIPMLWDYAESNTLEGSLNITSTIEWPASVIADLGRKGLSVQADAQTQTISKGKIVSTDPPYYDNISYANLSDFFYVWLRKSLRNICPDLFSTMLVPKQEELIASPYRQGSNEKAEEFFLHGMSYAMRQIADQAHPLYPVTIYYAFKQSEVSDKNGVSSTGWETFLTALLQAGFVITGTWPIRTERTKGLKGNVNALASSIVLVCRKRPDDAPQTTRRNLIAELRRDLYPALKKLQGSNIAPVDLAQAAIGPGMAVYSKYRRVLEADGTEMSVRSALQIINEQIDLYFNEQVGSMDTASRFCVDLYMQCAYNDIKYGEAEVLANAKGTSIPMMASHGVLYAKGGIVHLKEHKDLPEKVDTNEGNIWMLTQQLTYAMEKGGVEACAKIVASMFGSNTENAKDLAYRLYTIAEQKKWANEAFAYNALVVAWPDIQSKAAELKAAVPEQMSLFDNGLTGGE
mgnify:CR=1 FL=1